MSRKKVIIFFIILFIIIFANVSNAKYDITNYLYTSIFIDKTPPIISLECNDIIENYPKSEDEVIIKNDNVTLNSSDNVEIKFNEYYYNSTENNFENLEPIKFDNGKIIYDEGYYKIKAVDTSGNETEIIILIDKSAPEVNVTYFRKSNISKFIKFKENYEYLEV